MCNLYMVNILGSEIQKSRLLVFVVNFNGINTSTNNSIEYLHIAVDPIVEDSNGLA